MDVAPLLDQRDATDPTTPHCVSGPELVHAWERLRWLWRCATAEVDFLLLDEPTLGMDARHRAGLRCVLQAFKNAGCGIVLASHDLDIVRSLATRTLWLEGGHQVSCGPTADIVREYEASARRSA